MGAQGRPHRSVLSFGVTSNPQPLAPEARDWRHYGSRTALMLSATIAVYVLSFGPIFNLTTTKIGKGYMRPAKFPNWADTVNAVYSPLVHVLAGHPQRIPYKALAWYVHLCDIGPSMELHHADDKDVEAAVQATAAKLKKEKH
jgi:hypothetical protein